MNQLIAMQFNDIRIQFVDDYLLFSSSLLILSLPSTDADETKLDNLYGNNVGSI